MDELAKKRMLEQRKKEDEEFNMILEARLKRQFAFVTSMKGTDQKLIGEAIEEAEEESYEITVDENGDIEVSKQEE